MHDQPLALGGQSPYSSYRLLSLVFGAGLLGVACSRSARSAFSRSIGLGDFAIGAAAAHQLAHIVTSERVTMTLRSPFTWQRDTGRTGTRKEIPKGHGLRRAVGELVTCPYCITPWIASALVAGHIFAPVPTRTVATVFAITAAANWMSSAKTKLQHAGEPELEQRERTRPAEGDAHRRELRG